MKAGLITFTLCALIAAVPCHGEKKTRSAGGEVASGTGDIGKGAAKGPAVWPQAPERVP
jgi:hypothetical protein